MRSYRALAAINYAAAGTLPGYWDSAPKWWVITVLTGAILNFCYDFYLDVRGD